MKNKIRPSQIIIPPVNNNMRRMQCQDACMGSTTMQGRGGNTNKALRVCVETLNRVGSLFK